jgi:hypothetical protein
MTLQKGSIITLGPRKASLSSITFQQPLQRILSPTNRNEQIAMLWSKHSPRHDFSLSVQFSSFNGAYWLQGKPHRRISSFCGCLVPQTTRHVCHTISWAAGIRSNALHTTTWTSTPHSCAYCSSATQSARQLTFGLTLMTSTQSGERLEGKQGRE